MSTQQRLKSRTESSSEAPDVAVGVSPETLLPVDFDGLMQAHLAGVFSERNAGRRLDALKELYAEDATPLRAARSGDRI